MTFLILFVCDQTLAQEDVISVSEGSFAASSNSGSGCDLLRIPASSTNSGRHNLKTQQAEYGLGSRLAADVEQQKELISDDFILQYINHLEQKVTRSSALPGCFVVKVLSDPEPNAYSLPGGFIYVTAGLIDLIDSEGELVAVLAHETGHVTARHQTRIESETHSWGRLALVGGPAGFALRRYLGPLLMLKLVRNSEYEADRLGLRYTVASGYDPLEFGRLLQTAFADEQENDSFLDRLYDTHPPTKTRVERLQTAIPRLLTPKAGYIVNASEFTQMKKCLAKSWPHRATSTP
jgi:predicted Zn-dependent protease